MAGADYGQYGGIVIHRSYTTFYRRLCHIMAYMAEYKD